MSGPSYPTPTSPFYEKAILYARYANEGNIDAIGELLSDDFTHQFYPASNRPGEVERSNKQVFLERARQMLGESGLFKSINVSVCDVETPGTG